MNRTPNYGLEQPPANTYLDPNPFNRNMDIIDAKLKELEDGSDSVKGAPVLNELPADNDHIAISDASDGGKTKRVLWSRVKALFAGKSHTHPAGDVVSGVLDQARVPYLSDAERVVATVGPVWYNENRPGKSTITYTYPFSVTLDHIPKRVLLIICDSNELGLDNPYRLKGDGASATVDLTYDAGSGRFDAFVLAGKKDSQAKVNVTTVPCYLRNVNDLDRVLWLNGKRDDTVSPPEEKWDGYGGKAVFPFTYAGNQGAYTSLAIRVGKFRFDRSGVSLTVEVTSVGGQYDGFSVVGYVFD